jgi:D-glycero-beta-D-manno-heptose-7-phosphate kinase
MNVEELFESFSKIKVGVVGDVMLDTYMWGHVERISPEAPVPVVTLDQKEQRIGGAGNVALNLNSLGATAWVISVTGSDPDAKLLNELFTANGINNSYTIHSATRITTNKTRIISRNQQMMRLDNEITNDLSPNDEDAILASFAKFIKDQKPDIVVLEDYNKGVLTARVIHEVIAMCKKAGVLTAVDPKRKNFFEYKEADIFKPNLKEVKEALNMLYIDSSLSLLERIHGEMKQFLNHRISFITLSEKGIFYQEQNDAAIIPSHVRNVADVSGAGDTVIAVAALVYASTKNVHLMAEMANIAGGLVCEVVGTAAIDAQKLKQECQLLLS